MEQEKNFVEIAFDAARKANLCYNWREFGDLLGLDRSAMSKARKGEPSERIVLKIEKILADHGVVIGGDNNGTAIGTQQPAPQPTELQQVVSELTAQREMYDRQFSELLRQNSQLINIITNSLCK